MSQDAFQIRQLADELQLPKSGKESIVVTDDENTKIVLFAFAAGDGQHRNFACTHVQCES